MKVLQILLIVGYYYFIALFICRSATFFGRSSKMSEKEINSEPAKLEMGDEFHNQPQPKRQRFQNSEIIAAASVSGNETTIGQLPPEILMRIIQFLPMAQWPSLEIVNSNFQEATHQAWRMVRKIQMDADLLIKRGQKETEKIRLLNPLLEKLSLRAPNITSLRGFSAFSDGYSAVTILDNSIDLLCRFANLTDISLNEHPYPYYNPVGWFNDGCRIKLDRLANFLKSSASREKLKTLDVTYALLPFSSPATEGEAMVWEGFGGDGKLKLEEFILNRHEFWNGFDGFLAYIDVSCLKKLSFLNASMSPVAISALIERCDNLQWLGFTILWLDNKNSKEYRALLRSVAGLDKLSSFTVNVFGGERYGSNDGGYLAIKNELVQLVHQFGRRGILKEFSAVDSIVCGDELVLAISEKMRFVSSLELNTTWCSNGALTSLAQKIYALEKLHLRQDGYFSRKEESEYGAEFVSSLANCASELKHLHLLTDENYSANTLRKLAQLDKLEYLSISSTKVQDSVLKAWGIGFGDQLISLEIHVTGFLNDDLVIDVSDDGLLALIEKSPGLRQLGISRTKITDRSLQAIAALCPNLRRLEISWCSNITLKGVQGIIDACSQLKTLIAYGHSWFPEGLKVERYRKVNFE